jgi:Glycosyltransferase 61
MVVARNTKKKPLEVTLSTYLSCALCLLVWQFLVLSFMSEYQKTATRVLSSKGETTTNTAIQESHGFALTQAKNRNPDFVEGTLNVAPALHRQCVTIRFRGDENNYTVDDAISLLTEKYTTSPGPRHLRMGIIVMEDVNLFLPLRIRPQNNQYHLYHFVELLVMAYSELQRIATSLPIHAGYDTETIDPNIALTSLSKGSPSITVPWIFSPYMSPLEICGGKNNLNCLIADLILQGSKYGIFQNRSGIIGLKQMESFPFDYENGKMKGIDHRIELASYVYGDDPAFAQVADGVVLVERFGCNKGGINKPWSEYIDTFPAYSWHSDILYGLGRTWENSASKGSNPSVPRKLVIGYVDRQNTDRRLPDEHHNWLLQYCERHESIMFRQLHMEDYTALEQIELVSECDMLIGMHGNGLTHALWMPPRRYIIEFFWKYNYQFDYATTAHLMKHSYLGLMNGKVVDPVLVENRDPSLRRSPTRKEARLAPLNESMLAFEQEGKVAIQEFIFQAMLDLDIV